MIERIVEAFDRRVDRIYDWMHNTRITPLRVLFRVAAAVFYAIRRILVGPPLNG